MEQVKRQYENTFIINASLEDSQVESIITQVSETITRNGGEITALNKWGRKRLAYTIKKKNNGYYVNIEFVALGSVIPQLERMLTLNENIIRFLSIQLDEKALEARQQLPPVLSIDSIPKVEEIEHEPLFEDEEEPILPPAKSIS
jgi:small subunit ribosomal protein S6